MLLTPAPLPQRGEGIRERVIHHREEKKEGVILAECGIKPSKNY
jgi:hypothetical protein